MPSFPYCHTPLLSATIRGGFLHSLKLRMDIDIDILKKKSTDTQRMWWTAQFSSVPWPIGPSGGMTDNSAENCWCGGHQFTKHFRHFRPTVCCLPFSPALLARSCVLIRVCGPWPVPIFHHYKLNDFPKFSNARVKPSSISFILFSLYICFVLGLLCKSSKFMSHQILQHFPLFPQC